MNKQEQIEKMTRLICEDDTPYGDEEDKIECKDCCCYKDKRCTLYQDTATSITNAGYINGTDFVEWLKNKGDHFSCETDSEIEWNAIDVEDLPDLLQEYLKGE